MVRGIQRIQHQQAVRGGQAGLSAADQDRECAVLSQYSCIPRRERERAFVLLKCALELERPGEEIGQCQVAVGKIGRQGNRFARIALSVAEVVTDTGSRHQRPGEIRECE